MTTFSEGRYQVRIVNQCYTKSPEKGTPGFTLTFRVLRNVDEPEATVKTFQRSTTWWLTKKTVKRFLHDLHVLGYAGADIKDVDPDTPNFHDFRDQEVELTCEHEKTPAGVFEQWGLPNSKLVRLQDKSQLDELNRLLNSEPEPEPEPVSMTFGITDDDVPF